MWTKEKPATPDLGLLDDARFEGANIIDRVEMLRAALRAALARIAQLEGKRS